jgi:hypothetical protein
MRPTPEVSSIARVTPENIEKFKQLLEIEN